MEQRSPASSRASPGSLVEQGDGATRREAACSAAVPPCSPRRPPRAAPGAPCRGDEARARLAHQAHRLAAIAVAAAHSTCRGQRPPSVQRLARQLRVKSSSARSRAHRGLGRALDSSRRRRCGSHCQLRRLSGPTPRAASRPASASSVSASASSSRCSVRRMPAARSRVTSRRRSGRCPRPSRRCAPPRVSLAPRLGDPIALLRVGPSPCWRAGWRPVGWSGPAASGRPPCTPAGLAQRRARRRRCAAARRALFSNRAAVSGWFGPTTRVQRLRWPSRTPPGLGVAARSLSSCDHVRGSLHSCASSAESPFGSRPGRSPAS